MTGFLQAHGYDPGPTQRPMLAGALAGMAATAPATAILLLLGSVRAEAAVLELSVAATLLAGLAAMSLAGAAYGRLFGRAANDRAGGWLFGAAFGFLLWTGGPVMLLPALGGGRAPAGPAATGIFLALILWGAAAGGLFPFVHRLVRRRSSLAGRSGQGWLGPSAAALGRSPQRR